MANGIYNTDCNVYDTHYTYTTKYIFYVYSEVFNQPGVHAIATNVECLPPWILLLPKLQTVFIHIGTENNN